MAEIRVDNLGYLGAAEARRRPDKVAIIELAGEAVRRRSHGELQRRFDQVAALLQELGLKPGERFAVCVGNRLEYIEIVIGAMRSGVVPVPVNNRLGAETIAFIINDSGARAAFVEPSVSPAALAAVVEAGLELRISVGQAAEGWQDFEILMAAAPAFTPLDVGGDDILMQPYTSGSTGRPKGVPLSHAGQAWNLEACASQFKPVFSGQARALTANPLYHKNAFSGVVKPMLRLGASMVIMQSFEPRAFLRALAEQRCSYTITVPSIFALLLEHRDVVESCDYGALKGLLVGSAPCLPWLL